LVIGSSLQCDPFCPEVVRNSLGGIFHTPFVVSERDYVQAWLADHRWPVYQLHLSGQRSPQEVDLTQSAVLVMGAEDKGLDGSWSMLKGDRIKLPMRGLVDSLNVSVTAGIVLFEAVRQRATSVAE
jgi:RNA methyltransferase, TrmH family